MSELERAYRAAVIIPTVAEPSVLVPTCARIVAEARDAVANGGRPIVLVLAVNTPDPKQADVALDQIYSLLNSANAKGEVVRLIIYREDKPIGFGAANNRGLEALQIELSGDAASSKGLPDLIVFHNDDAHVTTGWLDGLLAALHTPVVHGYSEPWNPSDPESHRPGRHVDRYGRIGMVGPVSNLVAGSQLCTAIAGPGGQQITFQGDVDSFAAAIKRRYAGQRVTADFLSGFCVGLHRDAIRDLAITRDGGWIGIWDEDQYPIAGYEDNDLCVRAELAGWRAVVAADVFVGHIGHQTFDRLFPEMQRGMRNRQRYYDRWRSLTRPDRDLRLVSAMRLRFEVGNDVHLAATAIARFGTVGDGVAIVLTTNPTEVIASASWEAESRSMELIDRNMIEACAQAEGPEAIVEAVTGWVLMHCLATEGNRITSADQIRVECWPGGFNERDERNRTHDLAEDLGADWILSLDHDEVIENRVTRAHFDRWMRHPDPLVRSWDQAWLNHWDSPRLVREDPPWGDGGRFDGGMHGFRLWRVARNEQGVLAPARRRIMAGTDNGLHCGNSPEHEVMSKRVSGLRFRHFGYTRAIDRQRKHKRYQAQDPNPDPMLTGNIGRDAYGHLIHEEMMRLSPYVSRNGIGLHILMHEGETADALARVLDTYYGVVDKIVLVWTGKWEQDHQAWLRGFMAPAWPTTGPREDQARVAADYGCTWTHHELRDDLAAARNAGLSVLLDARATIHPGLGWALFVDLDEYPASGAGYAEMVAVRRMAETSDATGWLWRFINTHAGQEASHSESVRMARLIPELYLSGRVHETYDLSMQHYRANVADVTVRTAPFHTIHVGLAGDEAAMSRKLRRYQRLLLLELEDNPHNSQAWVSLALHLINDGHEDQAEEALQRAVLCAGDAYLAYRELGMLYARRSRDLLLRGAGLLPRGSEQRRALLPLLDVLRKVPDVPILGSAARGVPVCAPLELPPFPSPGPTNGIPTWKAPAPEAIAQD